MRFGLLAVLSVAVLVPSLSEGRLVSRCELRNTLGQAFPTNMTKGNFLTRVICEVGKRTQFNTSRLTIVGSRPSTTVKPTTTQRPAQTTVQSTGVGPVTNTSNTQRSQTTPGMIVTTAIQPNQTATSGTAARRRRYAKDSHEDNSHEDKKDSRSIGSYGLFQLTDRDACNSGYNPTKNVCQTQCDVFLDDNIADDIACLVKSVKSRAWEDLLSDSRCSPKDLVNYFAECV